MTNPETHYQAFFKDLRLGDFVQNRPKIIMHHTPIEFKSAVSSAAAHGFAAGPGVWFEVTTKIAFKRGYGGAETVSEFWDRIRDFMIALKARMSPIAGHKQLGPLGFVRDPNGTWTGKNDKDTSNGVISAGSPSAFTASSSLDSSPYDWVVGQKVLLIDPGNVSTFDWEIAEIETLLADAISLDEIIYAKADGTQMYRLDWYMPEVGLMNQLEIDGSGAVANGFVKDVELSWGGTIDPVQGGLA